MSRRSARLRRVLAPLVTLALAGSAACSPASGPAGRTAPPAATAGAGSTPPSSPTTAPASPGDRRPAGLPDPKQLNWSDATAVSRAAVAVMWTVDATVDTGQHGAYLRARPYLTPAYAQSVVQEPATVDIPAVWQEHRAYARVRLAPQKPESGAGPDTPTVAHRQWGVTIAPTGRDGWKGPRIHAIAFVTLTRPAPGAQWRVSAVTTA